MEIPFSVLAQVGGGGLGWLLFALAGWFVLTGRLVPGSLYQEAREEAKTWRAVALRNGEQRDALLVPAVRTQVDILNALPRQPSTGAETEEVGT